ncbi:MAG: uracil-DNA glycosylase, partial [Solirubrobacteraceae bacterium]|nr:uracil-DNA glycosylase [Solirubrobacteraceae bacterium]
RLLEEIGLARADVFIANTLKCRPPGNRDPHPAEIENCQDYLLRQVALIQPLVICTLGNFATKLLRADPTGITRLHGRDEVRVIGTRAVRLYPIFHPAAALYTPSNVEVLRADFARIPALLALEPPPQPGVAEELPAAAVPEPEVDREPELDGEPDGEPEPDGDPVGVVDDRQLGLF